MISQLYNPHVSPKHNKDLVLDTLGGPVCDKMSKSKLGKLVNDQSVDDALQQLVKVDHQVLERHCPREGAV